MASIVLDGTAIPGGHMERPKSVLVEQAATILGISRRTVYYRIREGRLRTVRTMCGSQRVLMDSVEELRREAAWKARRRMRRAGGYRPSRWRLRYRPLREMPSARAAASTRPP